MESKYIDTKEERGGGINLETGIGIYTLDTIHKADN